MTNRFKLRAALLATAALAPAAVVPCTAYAQQEDGASPAAAGVEQLVVTARRRAESLQTVPLSVTAFSSEDMSVRSIESGRDFAISVPNLVMAAGGLGQQQSELRIRGVPGVGIYLDGVWQGPNGVLQANLVEMDRIEVLRGPQGTLFGRNTNGGAVQYVTRAPGDEMGGDIRLTVGSFNRRDLKASIDIPLADGLYTKWTAASFEHDGYLESVSAWDRDDTSYGDSSDTFLRGDILWEPTDSFSARLTAFDARQQGTEIRQVRFSTQPGAEWFNNPHIKAMNWLMAQPDQAGRFPEPAFDPIHYESGYPGGEVGEWETKARQPADSAINNSQDATLTVSWDLTDNFTLESITAFRKEFTHQLSLQDAADFVACCRDDRYFKDELFSEEVHLTGDLFDGFASFLAGAYYSRATNKLRLYRWWQTPWYLPDTNGDGNPEVNTDLLTRVRAYGTSIGDASLANYNLLPASVWMSSNHTWTKSHQEEQALFGEVDFNLTDALEVTLGVRWSWRDILTDTYRPGLEDAPALFMDPGILSTAEFGSVGPGDMWGGVVVPPAVPGINHVNVDATFTPKVSVTYQWTDDFMTYASYAEGFSEGDVVYVAAIDQIFTLDPEVVKSYEAGFKSDLFDSALRLNAAAFYGEWDNLRVSRHPIDPNTGLELPTPYNTDDGKAEVYGGEAEIVWAVTEGLQLDLNGGYLHTEYIDIGDEDVSSLRFGAPFAYSPEWSFSVGAQYDMAVAATGGDLTLRADYGWKSEYERDPSVFRQSPEPEPAYGLLNAMARHTSGDGAWSVSVFGTNLTNEHYVDGGFISAGVGLSLDTVGPPREYGVTLDYRF